MTAARELRCPGCNAEIKIEFSVWSTSIDVRMEKAKSSETFGRVEIECEGCGRAVAELVVALR